MRSKTDSPPLVMYWSRMAEIKATVFPDFEGPRKMPVHGTRGTIGCIGDSRGPGATCADFRRHSWFALQAC